jgi:ATP-dependent DNA helicase RecQ
VILAAAVALGAAAGFTGRRRLINHLRGNQRPIPGPGDEGAAPGFAVLESHHAGWVEEAVDRLTEEGYLALAVVGGGSRLSLTPEGRKVAGGGGLLAPEVLPVRPRLGTHPEIEERLRAARRELAAREGVPPYRIFPNSVLAELAARRPASLAELAHVAGFGEARVRKYGRRIVRALGK